jgi:tetratricopeptide (TPR) repeat protein
LDEVVAAAHEHGAPEVEAAGLFHRGAIHQRRRVHAPANAAFEQAADLAEEGGDDELVARAWIYLAQGQAILGHIDSADQSIRRARAKARRLHDARLDHEVDEAQVVAAWQAGRFPEAIEGQRAVVERTQQSFGLGHPRTADAELRFAHILGDAGRHAEAQDRYEGALDALGRAFGPEHPALARALFDIGTDHREAGRDAEALQALEEAERRFVSSLGAEAPELLDVNKAMADLAQRRGDFEEADRRIGKAVALSQRTGRPDHEQLDLLSLQAMVASQRDEHARTIEICQAYLEQLRTMPANADSEIQALFMRAILVTALGAAGRHDDAEPAARQLVEELADRGEDDAIASLRAHAWLVIGRATEARGELQPAAVAYRAGLESLAAVELTGPDLPVVKARLQWRLGQVLAPSQAAAARVLVVDAREALARAKVDAPELAEIDAWLD